jgi:hypothetical protein
VQLVLAGWLTRACTQRQAAHGRGTAARDRPVTDAEGEGKGMARRRVRRDGRWIDTFGQARTHDHTQLDQSMEPQALEACSLARGEHRRSSTRSTRGMHGVQGRDIDCEAKRQHSCVETHELGSAQVSVSVSGLVLPCPDPDRAPSVHARTSKIRSLRRPALANTDFHTYVRAGSLSAARRPRPSD